MRRDVFQAIADPTRREIINLIAHRTHNLNAVAERFHISRPAISKHIKILTECGLITVTQKGRERYCAIQPEKLDEVSEWVNGFRKIWEQRFDKLDALLSKMQSEKNKEIHKPLNVKHNEKQSNFHKGPREQKNVRKPRV